MWRSSILQIQRGSRSQLEMLFLSVIDRFRAIHADSHRRSTETMGPRVIWTDLAKLISRVLCSQPATGVLNAPYPVRLNLPLFYFTILWANYRSVYKWKFPIFFPFWMKVIHIYIKDMHTSELNISLKKIQRHTKKCKVKRACLIHTLHFCTRVWEKNNTKM